MTKGKNSSDKTYKPNKTAEISSDNSNLYDSEKTLRADAKENREQILQVAHNIFAEKGLSVPISEIAREAKVGVGTIYRHFSTKEGLFNAVNMSYKQKFTEEANSLINHPDPGQVFFDFFFRIMEECYTNKSVRDAFRFGTFRVRKATSGVLLDFQSACEALLLRAQQTKAVREDIDIMDLFVFMTGILMVVDETEDVSNRSRFNKILSIACDGFRYKK